MKRKSKGKLWCLQKGTEQGMKSEVGVGLLFWIIVGDGSAFFFPHPPSFFFPLPPWVEYRESLLFFLLALLVQEPMLSFWPHWFNPSPPLLHWGFEENGVWAPSFFLKPLAKTLQQQLLHYTVLSAKHMDLPLMCFSLLHVLRPHFIHLHFHCFFNFVFFSLIIVRRTKQWVFSLLLFMGPIFCWSLIVVLRFTKKSLFLWNCVCWSTASFLTWWANISACRLTRWTFPSTRNKLIMYSLINGLSV